LFKSLFVSLNILSINCRGQNEYVSSPGDITAYGGPILYLTVQSLVLFVYLVWWESGNKLSALLRWNHRGSDAERKYALEPEVLDELDRVSNSMDDGLRVLHLSKFYGNTIAVDDVSFGVKTGEVFGLLGPNGAGKSTTIGVIRGDIRPSTDDGDVLIEKISLRKKKALARQHLSACPQHDAVDRLTVTEHLDFYARIRGVADVSQNVEQVIRAVGLGNFRTRMAEALSGGNKRKLSLGIALMGNPAVMLLDEPSSGLDVAAKRVMWRTLDAVVPGRSIVLTTHSMEEADRLCSRAGILAKRMLAVGTSDYLRKKHGDRYYVHLVLKSAPHTSSDEAGRVRAWIESEIPIMGAEIEGGIWHGQVRFSVPIGTLTRSPGLLNDAKSMHQDIIEADDLPETKSDAHTEITGGLGALFEILEANKIKLGFDHYSVSQTSLDQVFLSIVGKHNIEEENAGIDQPTRRQWWNLRLPRLFS
jgi:ABC-type multidrug transport system ATPase subunit